MAASGSHLSTHDHAASTEAACHREYFYVGGEYVDDERRDGQRVMQGQMYVEKLIPISGIKHPLPMVFIHGIGQTAAASVKELIEDQSWLNTPDGRKGWASYFVDHGYMIYLIDSPSRGRSGSQPSADAVMTVPVSFAERYWTSTNHYKLWPQAQLHTQWPGSGHAGDAIFDAYYASLVQSREDVDIEQTNFRSAGIALLDHIGPAILITHSQGGPFGWLLADARPKLVKAIVAIEPTGPPFVNKLLKGPSHKPYGITDIPLTYDPPLNSGDVLSSAQETNSSSEEPCVLQAEPARKLVNLIDTPVVLVTAEASYHMPYDECTVKFLRQAGVDVQWLNLADHGIKGNGHMMFMELNNLEIAQLLETWIASMI